MEEEAITEGSEDDSISEEDTALEMENASAAWSGDFEYTLLENGDCKITRYGGSKKDVVIPSSLDGHRVIEVSGAEYNHSAWGVVNTFPDDIISLTLPSTVRYLSGFYNNSQWDNGWVAYNALTSVKFDASGCGLKTISGFTGLSTLTHVDPMPTVEVIDNSTFQYCNNLTYLEFGDSLTQIGNSAFSGCTSLKTVKLGKFVTTLGTYIFNGCSSLMDPCLPDSVSEIPEGTFQGCSSLSSVSIPKRIKSVGENAFNGCTSLRGNLEAANEDGTGEGSVGVSENADSLTLPSTTAFIGYQAFQNCTALSSVKLYDTAVTYLENGTFEGCTHLKSVTLPRYLSSVGENAFKGCSSLGTFMSLPDGVTSIGAYAFRGCTALQGIDIPDSTVSIASTAFADTHLLKIYCGYNSTAHDFAKKNSMYFDAESHFFDDQELWKITNDTNLTGKVTLEDCKRLFSEAKAQEIYKDFKNNPDPAMCHGLSFTAVAMSKFHKPAVSQKLSSYHSLTSAMKLYIRTAQAFQDMPYMNKEDEEVNLDDVKGLIKAAETSLVKGTSYVLVNFHREYDNGSGQGHTILVTGIKQYRDDKWTLLVYDSNFPEKTRELDITKNIFSYSWEFEYADHAYFSSEDGSSWKDHISYNVIDETDVDIWYKKITDSAELTDSENALLRTNYDGSDPIWLRIFQKGSSDEAALAENFFWVPQEDECIFIGNDGGEYAQLTSDYHSIYSEIPSGAIVKMRVSDSDDNERYVRISSVMTR